MPKIIVDGQEYQVKEGGNILEACIGVGLDLPYFCWHPAMGSIGSCRQCALIQYQNEDDTRGRIVMGCMTPVTEGARFSLQADNAREFRENIIEALMINHPHDCPVCAEGGECHLQDMTVMVGHRDRHYRGLKNTHRNQYLGPLIHHEMNRCITCYRCVRFYNDYAGGTDLSAQACHDHLYFGRQRDGVLENEFSGNLVEVCPTGVFTDKPFLKQYTRKWDLQSAPSVCNGCAVGCNTIPGERYGVLKRIHNRYNHEVNGYFLCDRGRFGSGYVNGSQRLDFAGQRNPDGTFSAINRTRAIELAANWIGSGRVVAIGSPRASLEANWQLRELVGADNFVSGVSASENVVNSAILDTLQATSVKNPSVKDMESADAVLILGEDVTNTAPRVALALRQAVRNKGLELAKEARFLDWQDAAIRNLAQDTRSPLIIVSPMDSRLDDIASELHSIPPQSIAGFTDKITQAIAGGVEDTTASGIAEQLRRAKRPLVISGSGLLRADIVNSARRLAETLQEQGCQPMLSFCMSEANSMGLTMLAGGALEDLVDDGSRIDTLLIMENDLARRLPADRLHALIAKAGKVIGLDLVEHATLDNCDLVLPVASYAESEGSLVSSEGRAQRYFPVFEPRQERLPDWQWLMKLAAAVNHKTLSLLNHFDDLVAACAASSPMFSGLVAAVPDQHYRSHGLKIPRQTHRYSGRTAMQANVSVHEPQQPQDEETPLAYTMEGLNRDQPGSLRPYFWSPGWNSNQSVQRFQQEVGGPMRGGPAGVRLLDAGAGAGLRVDSRSFVEQEQELEHHTWQLVPLYHIHGSEELTALTDEIAELAGPARIAVGEVVAGNHGVTDGDGLVVSNGEHSVSLEVQVLKRVAKNCVGFSAGFSDTQGFVAGEHVSLHRDENWRRRQPRMIATDANTGGLPNG
jgi:NADH-quinone oxidoreductase subunit G